MENLRVPEDADRDFVAGAFVVRDGKVLMLNHKKYDIWLQPGGHVEERETPDEAAVRETLEETGLEIEIVDPQGAKIGKVEDEEAYNLPQPINLNLHKVRDGHWHCDFLYMARVEREVEQYEYDDDEIKWFSEEELRSEDYQIPENARKPALKALDQVNSSE